MTRVGSQRHGKKNIIITFWDNSLELLEALVIASEETELEVNADKKKYMVMSRDQNVG